MRYYEFMRENKIEEVFLDDTYSDPGIKLEKYSKDPKHKLLLNDNGYYYFEDDSDDKFINIIVFHNDVCIAVMNTTTYETPFPMIYGTKTSDEYQRQGIMSRCFDLFVKKHGSLYSDSKQSPSASNMWKKYLSTTSFKNISII